MIGKNFIYLTTCQSTNSHLASLSQQESLPEGTLVYTAEQTAGRGQRGNTWESAPQQNLTFSYLLYPDALPLDQMFLLSMATALGVYDFLHEHVGEAVRIKYPNDLLVGKQKIGGILIENSLRGEHIERSIIGIGLNINQLEFQNARATSLALACPDAVFEPMTCLHALTQYLDLWYKMLKDKKYSEIKANFLAKSFQFNELCRYFTEAGEIEGKIIDVDFAGALHLETVLGLRKFYFKEIAFFPPSDVVN